MVSPGSSSAIPRARRRTSGQRVIDFQRSMIHGLRLVLNIRGEGRRGSTAQSSQNRAIGTGKRNDRERRNRDGAGGRRGRAGGAARRWTECHDLGTGRFVGA